MTGKCIKVDLSGNIPPYGLTVNEWSMNRHADVLLMPKPHSMEQANGRLLLGTHRYRASRLEITERAAMILFFENAWRAPFARSSF